MEQEGGQELLTLTLTITAGSLSQSIEALIAGETFTVLPNIVFVIEQGILAGGAFLRYENEVLTIDGYPVDVGDYLPQFWASLMLSSRTTAALSFYGKESNIKKISITAIAVTSALAGGLAGNVVSVDHYAGTYGVSIGTDTRYCSIEARLPVFTCEAVVDNRTVRVPIKTMSR